MGNGKSRAVSPKTGQNRRRTRPTSSLRTIGPEQTSDVLFPTTRSSADTKVSVSDTGRTLTQRSKSAPYVSKPLSTSDFETPSSSSGSSKDVKNEQSSRPPIQTSGIRSPRSNWGYLQRSANKNSSEVNRSPQKSQGQNISMGNKLATLASFKATLRSIQKAETPKRKCNRAPHPELNARASSDKPSMTYTELAATPPPPATPPVIPSMTGSETTSTSRTMSAIDPETDVQYLSKNSRYRETETLTGSGDSRHPIKSQTKPLPITKFQKFTSEEPEMIVAAAKTQNSNSTPSSDDTNNKQSCKLPEFLSFSSKSTNPKKAGTSTSVKSFKRKKSAPPRKVASLPNSERKRSDSKKIAPSSNSDSLNGNFEAQKKSSPMKSSNSDNSGGRGGGGKKPFNVARTGMGYGGNGVVSSGRRSKLAPPVYISSYGGSCGNGDDCRQRLQGNPLDRLRNVDVIESLCYYPGNPCQTNCCGGMDMYSVCDDCGGCEYVGEKLGGNPVTYTRKQRFNFKHPDDEVAGSCCEGGPPYVWPSVASPYCPPHRVCSFDELPVGKNPGCKKEKKTFSGPSGEYIYDAKNGCLRRKPKEGEESEEGEGDDIVLILDEEGNNANCTVEVQDYGGSPSLLIFDEPLGEDGSRRRRQSGGRRESGASGGRRESGASGGRRESGASGGRRESRASESRRESGASEGRKESGASERRRKSGASGGGEGKSRKTSDESGSGQTGNRKGSEESGSSKGSGQSGEGESGYRMSEGSQEYSQDQNYDDRGQPLPNNRNSSFQQDQGFNGLHGLEHFTLPPGTELAQSYQTDPAVVPICTMLLRLLGGAMGINIPPENSCGGYNQNPLMNMMPGYGHSFGGQGQMPGCTIPVMMMPDAMNFCQNHSRRRRRRNDTRCRQPSQKQPQPSTKPTTATATVQSPPASTPKQSNDTSTTNTPAATAPTSNRRTENSTMTSYTVTAQYESGSTNAGTDSRSVPKQKADASTMSSNSMTGWSDSNSIVDEESKSCTPSGSTPSPKQKVDASTMSSNSMTGWSDSNSIVEEESKPRTDTISTGSRRSRAKWRYCKSRK